MTEHGSVVAHAAAVGHHALALATSGPGLAILGVLLDWLVLRRLPRL